MRGGAGVIGGWLGAGFTTASQKLRFSGRGSVSDKCVNQSGISAVTRSDRVLFFDLLIYRFRSRRMKNFSANSKKMRREPNGPRLFFATALSVSILGHADIDVTHAVPPRSPALRRRAAYSWNVEAQKTPVNAGIGWVRISAKSGCKHSRAKGNAGVYVRNLPSRCLCVRLWGSKDRRECRPHGARFALLPCPRFV